MARLGKNITDAELAVLEVLWEQGPATIRQITEVLYPKGTTAHYATVQKLLERLEAKKYIQRNREGPALAHLFLASIDRDALISRQLQSMA
jgi:predicted transcriptional regulator